MKSISIIIIILLCCKSFSTSSYYSAAILDRKTRINYSYAYNIQDPRKNSSYYDIAIKENCSYGTIIGSVSDLLAKKKIIDKTSSVITKYKLIYYSPQLIPSVILSTLPTMTNSNNADLEPLFTVDSQNGSIFIHTPNKEPTLEYLCLKRKYCSCFSCIFSLNIIFMTGENKINAETIRVFIDDHNDAAPKFSNDLPINISISELSLIGDSFKLSNAIAHDSDAYYNQITYYLSDHDETSNGGLLRSNSFDVMLRSEDDINDDNSNWLNLVLKTHLDYETKRLYELYLFARDNGSPIPLRTSKKVFVHIIDENDNSPVCEKSLFIGSLSENVLARDFLEIRAFDLDSGANGKVKYKLLSQASPTATTELVTHVPIPHYVDELFEIDENTGWLSVKRPLDYEKKSYYELIVKVTDSSLNNTFSTFCTARVNIIDLNDNPARIKIIKYLNESVQTGYYALNTQLDIDLNDRLDQEGFLVQSNQIEFFENNESNMVLALIRVFDYDSLSNYRFQIQSVTNSPEDTSMFEIRASDKSRREFELVGLKRFDADTIQNYRLKIVLHDLQDAGDNGDLNGVMIAKRPEKLNEENNFSLFVYQTIKVLDLNDNGPLFFNKNKTYEFSVAENAKKGYVLSQTINEPIEVFDIDASEVNSKISFRLTDTDNLTRTAIENYIYVNDSNYNYPLLVLNNYFDYEINGNKFEFNLFAYDLDNKTDMARVRIKIEDLNDNAPEFLNENATFSIRENTATNNFIGQVLALDKDSSLANSALSFKIKYDHLASIFKVDSKSGVLTNKVVFNREIQSFYALKIDAFDSGERPNKQQTTGTFYIKIEDENDNAPVFLYPNEMAIHYMHFTAKKSNNKLVRLFDAEASDLDLDDNARIIYHIKDSLNLLEINSTNGTVYLNMNRLMNNRSIGDLKRILKVNLIAQDCGSPPLSKSINFTLYLNYDRDELPVDVLKQIEEDLQQSQQPPILTNFNSEDKFDANNLMNPFRANKNEVVGNRTTMRNTFQNISNTVLIVILMVVLLFMVFIACFIFVTVYKKYVAKKKRTNNSFSFKSSSTGLQTPPMTFNDPSAATAKRFKCIDQVKSYLRAHHCKLNTFKSLNDEQNLTVKDASIIEIKSNLALIEPVLNYKVKNNQTDEVFNIDRLVVNQPKENEQRNTNEAILKLNELSIEATKTAKSQLKNSINRFNKASFSHNSNQIYSNETIRLKTKNNNAAVTAPTYQELECNNYDDDSVEVKNYICNENLNRHVNHLLDYPALTKAFIINDNDLNLNQDVFYKNKNLEVTDSNLIDSTTAATFNFNTSSNNQLPVNFSQNLTSTKLKQMLNPTITSITDNNNTNMENFNNRINIYHDNLNMGTQVLNNLLKKL